MAVVAVGIDVTGQDLLLIAFKMFQIVNGFIQRILVTSKHFYQVPSVQLLKAKL